MSLMEPFHYSHKLWRSLNEAPWSPCLMTTIPALPSVVIKQLCGLFSCLGWERPWEANTGSGFSGTQHASKASPSWGMLCSTSCSRKPLGLFSHTLCLSASLQARRLHPHALTFQRVLGSLWILRVEQPGVLELHLHSQLWCSLHERYAHPSSFLNHFEK